MKLSRKHLSIFPTQHGFLFLGILVAMLAGSINYNNNAGFILVFLLGSMALISLFHSFKNLMGLEIDPLSVRPVFAGQKAIFPFQVKAGTTSCQSVLFALSPHDQIFVSIDRKKNIQMKIPAPQRGILQPDTLTISSVYPFGLFNFRAKIPAQTSCFVYPLPIPGPLTTVGGQYSLDGEIETSCQGVDDFQGLKQYQPGHSFGRIAWKTLSRGRGLFIKEFIAEDSLCLMLDFDAIPEKDLEKKLSRLCHMILAADRKKMEYGLRLPPAFIQNPGVGAIHKHSCLKALALFNLREGSR
jgi:uncharacterized protein (DUF58 family)